MSVKLGGGGAAAAGLTAESVLPAGYARAVEDFKALQGELQAAVGKQTTLEAQRNENHLVKEELDALKEGEGVYKLIGKVLVKQDATEARSTVNGRLSFLETELLRVEASVKGAQEKMLAARRRIMEMQQSAQQQQQQQQQQGGRR